MIDLSKKGSGKIEILAVEFTPAPLWEVTNLSEIKLYCLII